MTTAAVAQRSRKLVVADLSNIEGRMCAWLAGEEWKLQAFREFDASLIVDDQGRPVLDAKGERQFAKPDLYRVAYGKAFAVNPATVTKDQRQIGKVMELMLQYQGGVGAFLTGAATYGIDLAVMAEAALPSIPPDVLEEAQGFMAWRHEEALVPHLRRAGLLPRKEKGAAEEPKYSRDDYAKAYARFAALDPMRLAQIEASARFNLTPRVFVVCDSLKRLWRRAHPRIANLWGEIEDAVRLAIARPGSVHTVGKLKMRAVPGWLQVRLPSGRNLCYPAPRVNADGGISYMGLDQYTRQWKRLHTYGGKFLENFTQAASCDQLAECMPAIEAAGYPIVLSVHDEYLTEPEDRPEFSADHLAELMTSDLGWNQGLPLAAAGYETYRYRKG